MNDQDQPNGDYNHFGRHGFRGSDRIPLGSLVDGDAATGQIFYVDANKEVVRLDISVPAANVRNVLGVDNGDTIPAWKTALDGTAPTKVVIPSSSAAGTSLIFSHRDHTHGADAHNVLSASHLDTTVASVVRGDIIYGNATPAWDRLAKPSAAAILTNDATDVAWDTMAWTAVTYAAGDFTAVTGTWTVASGDVTTFAYRMIGSKTMVVAFTLLTTSLSAGTSAVFIKIPNSKTANRTIYNACFINDNGTTLGGYCTVPSAGTTIQVGKVDGTNLAIATNTTSIVGEITFEVQ